MKTTVEMRDEAARIRAFALTVTDAETLAALQEMIDELETRALALEVGAGGCQ